MGLELLRAAAEVGIRDGSRQLTPNLLRFSLFYKSKPKVSEERAKLEALLAATGFELFPLPSGDDPLILILQFPGVIRQQSTQYLLSTADALVDALKLVACAPDADPGWIAEDEIGRDAPESIGGMVWELCRSHVAPPTDPLWSVKAVKAPAAWERFGVRGEGVRIGQPDTGVADHRELDGALDLQRGIDILKGSGPPIDPLSRDMMSPGHGTATASVVTSRAAGRMMGAAPAATIVPIRCVDSVVLSSGVAVAAAIDHARREKCDIVTMSLGGPFPFTDLRRAIERAVDAGMIVLAAAGNCVKLVVYPAWDENVIAVAAVAESGRPWPGTSRGSKVDVSAPGESVFIARRTAPSDVDRTRVEPGEGTSFAVTTTAGCAALWIEHHGRDKIRKAAKTRGVTVQQLFRAALRQTASRFPGWDAANMGAGIVDAEALLALPLKDIDLARVVVAASEHPARFELGSGFDWARYGVEAGYLALDRRQRRDPRRIGALESPVAPRPTPGFVASAVRAGASQAPLLSAPTVITAPITPEVGPMAALRIVARVPSGGGAESSGIISEASARSYLEGAGRHEVLELFGDVESRLATDASSDPAAAELRARIRQLVPDVLDRLARGVARSSADFTGLDRFAAEALILLTGRPALRTVDGMVEKDNPQMGAWAGHVFVNRKLLKPLVDAVGRIDIEEGGRIIHVGTGTHVAPGVILTNRHVLDAVAEQLPSRAGKRRFELMAPVSIVFDDDASDATKRFKIKSVIAAGPDRIGALADIRLLDVAFLEVESENGSGKLPKPAGCSEFPVAAGPNNIAVIGYPAAPNIKAMIDPDTGTVSEEMSDVLATIYGTQWGKKYLSAGEIGFFPGTYGGDERSWIFTHDATTLWGNSGSAAIFLGDAFPLCGLHFGGAPRRRNLGHSLDAVKRQAAADPKLLDGNWPC